MSNIIPLLHQAVWGIPAITAILGVGCFYTIRTKFAQLRLLPNGLKVFAKQMVQSDSNSKDITPYQAFCTSLGATVGTGNIIGVAGAISIGGPGAVFWMWVSAILGMIIKYAEALLAVHYQQKEDTDTISAGPMYIIRNGMKRKWLYLSYVYAFLGVVASFGVGNAVQINAAVTAVKNTVTTLGSTMQNHWILVLGFLSAILISVVLTGGAKRITAIAELLVPVVSAAYILLCVGVLAARWREIDNTIITIVRGAFSPIAITGGAVGSIFQTVRVGIARGVFTNEAGLGTAGIAHGSTKVEHPAMQGVLGIVEVFLDTIVICTLTAFVILCCDIPIAYGTDMGGELTTAAFISIWGKWIVIPLGLIIICLAVATIIGWGLYGLKCAQYIFGNQDGKMFVILQALAAFAGAVTQSSKIWLLAEVVNGLMMLPNLILLVHQSNIVKKLTQEYKGKLRKNKRAIFRKRNVLHKSFFRAAISDSESRRGV